MADAQTDFEKKKLDPRSAYQHPDEVLKDDALTRDQKVEILKEWHYDAIRLQESAGENMTGGEPDMLRAVSKALLALDVSPVEEADPNAPKAKETWSSALKTRLRKVGDYFAGRGQV
jgi:hypothetical protein